MAVLVCGGFRVCDVFLALRVFAIKWKVILRIMSRYSFSLLSFL